MVVKSTTKPRKDRRFFESLYLTSIDRRNAVDFHIQPGIQSLYSMAILAGG